jgi:hypothetical protein
MLEFVLSAYIGSASIAQTIFTLHASGMVCFGAVIGRCWRKRWEEAIDVVMTTLGIMGIYRGFHLLDNWCARVGHIQGVDGSGSGWLGAGSGDQGKAVSGNGGEEQRKDG